MIIETFANNLRYYRKKQNLSLKELAKISNIDCAQICRIEQGKLNITIASVEKLSKALNLPISHFFLNPKKELNPFVKWAGGKRQILGKLRKLMPSEFNNYFEPFVGGGALLFDIQPTHAFINDLNGELISAYKCFKNKKCFLKLKKMLKEHESNHNENYFLKIRSLDQTESFNSLPNEVKAARMIYLNKSCFNGLYRVNSKGFFNVPSNKKEKIITFDENNFNNIYEYFKNNQIEVTSVDFEKAVNKAKSGDFVYFDPPYDVIKKDTFTSYTKNEFNKDEQIRLANVLKKLSKKV